jgi:hypothetical protein
VRDKYYEQTYMFMTDLEALVYDYTKSILIDAEALKFKPSIIVCGVISISFEIFFLVNYNKGRVKDNTVTPIFL